MKFVSLVSVFNQFRECQYTGFKMLMKYKIKVERVEI